MRRRNLILGGLGCGLLAAGLWLGLTDNLRIWPVRNTLQYRLFERLPALAPQPGAPAAVYGTVRDSAGRPIANAMVAVAAHDGTTYSAETDAQGGYTIPGVPAGSYVPAAAAAGYTDTFVRRLGLLRVGVDGAAPLNITLQPAPPPGHTAASDFQLSAGRALQVNAPLPASAISQTVTYRVAGRPNQTTLFFTPNDGATTPLPVLLCVYPGAAETWDTVSFPLAAAGYAVIAVGPAYALDLEPDVDDLERLLDAVRAGQLPRADPARIAVLGGSYSSLHVLRLLERNDQPVRAALLMGPPTDLFEMRRQYVINGLVPPFDLDQALIALGFPDRNPEPYWRYSARFHARSLTAPLMLIHSKTDEVIPFAQSQLLSDELQRIGTPHELHILEGMGHYLLATERTPAVDALYAMTLDFFKAHLR